MCKNRTTNIFLFFVHIVHVVHVVHIVLFISVYHPGFTKKLIIVQLKVQLFSI